MLRPSEGTRPLMHQAPLSNKHLSYDSASHTGSAYFMTVMFISWRVYPRPHSTSTRSSSSLGFFPRFFFYSAMHPFLFFIHSVSPLLCNTTFSHAMPLLLLIHFVRKKVFFVVFFKSWELKFLYLRIKAQIPAQDWTNSGNIYMLHVLEPMCKLTMIFISI